MAPSFIRLSAVILAAWPALAQAELGGTLASVEVDRGRMAARVAHLPQTGFTRHVLTRPNGGIVHELTNAQGQVFAVSWSGPGKPNLSTLLGRYAAALAPNPAIGRSLHAFRRPVAVSQPGLQLVSEGHMGWFHGAAVVPSLAPNGFSVADLTVTQ
jgi:hypothetical protein